MTLAVQVGECMSISKIIIALTLRVGPTSEVKLPMAGGCGGKGGSSAGPASALAKSLAKIRDRN